MLLWNNSWKIHYSDSHKPFHKISITGDIRHSISSDIGSISKIFLPRSPLIKFIVDGSMKAMILSTYYYYYYVKVNVQRSRFAGRKQLILSRSSEKATTRSLGNRPSSASDAVCFRRREVFDTTRDDRPLSQQREKYYTLRVSGKFNTYHNNGNSAAYANRYANCRFNVTTVPWI